MWVCEHVIPASSLGSSGQAKEAPLAESQTSELPRDDLALETLRSSEELWKVKVKVKSCPTLCDPMDCSPTGTSVHGILQARILDGLSFPSPGDLPDLGIEPTSPALQADSLLSEPPEKAHEKQ